MKYKKNLKKCAIIVSILVLILDICLYIRLQQSLSNLIETTESYTSFGIIISSLFQYGSLVYGIGAILIVWIEYFLICFLLKVYNKFNGLKRGLAFLITLIIVLALFIIFARIITFIYMLLF